MANPALLTALGTIGAGLSQYGETKRQRDTLAREMEALGYTRSRQARLDALAEADRAREIAAQEYAKNRQRDLDVLNALGSGLRPAGGLSSLTLGGQQFELPKILTPEEQVTDRTNRLLGAYPRLTRPQADAIARGLVRIGDVLPDPGTMRPQRQVSLFDNPFSNGPRSLTETLFPSSGR